MFDICIIGGGVAGLMLAHSLPASMSIAILTKEDPFTSNTALAQGGIAASLAPYDSPATHAIDTMLATADHAHHERVEMLVNEGKLLIEKLMSQGLPFDANSLGLPELGQEAAHTQRRILHAGGDQTGKMLMHYLLKQTQEKVTLLPFHAVLKLKMEEGRCTGAIVSDQHGHKQLIKANHVVLATGGIGQLYSQTSNSPIATGDGLSLAYHAGAILEDLEFVQFHPTIFTLNGKSCGLISEAVRGEGAFLVNQDGIRVMKDVHPLMELAPRDIVARVIEWHWQKNDPIYLDARYIHRFEMKFPSIYANCMRHGINPIHDLMPVRPGAHFHMGGVQTNDVGETSIPQLYAIGEVASTGVHGANRLASNSLLEGLVFAERLAKRVEENVIRSGTPFDTELDSSFIQFSSAHMQRRMTEHIGIIRTGDGLSDFIQEFPLHPRILEEYSIDEVQQIHRYTASSLIAHSAFLRTESRGSHYRQDYPAVTEEWTGKIIEQSINGISISTRKIERKETVK
ncbi:L-aspartate oxidase [Paenisporosarcina quisquiliarum]|uniref:L-aspartate oxidase n=1 Tax=Paenisporosarcina quisquiliarum TaxID=365346 RepID=A0A9X3RE43_9BACL|nr:L-aspartate oxidase [Paenisporosarcina quisquiliarum]MCZ8538470.1 L-aspartate oxidase [Paenisporosarcina quisquiliarum]